MENNAEMAGEDIFTQGFEDEAGGLVSDRREAEPLPEDGGESAGESSGGGEDEASGGEKAGEFRTPAGDERSRQILRFVREFPQVSAQDVPAEVWEGVRRGETLTEAYIRWDAARLREENRRLLAQTEARVREGVNRAMSAGSQRGSGGTVRDAFDEGWDGAF